nr:tetratricopeptide repeat protein [Planosporangium mesophilum]
MAEGLAEAERLRERWQFAAARDVLTALLSESPEPADRLPMVTGRRMLAEVLRDLGEADEAYAVARPLAAECEERFGERHPATARALTVLATVVHARGDLAAAAELYGRVLDGRLREQGPTGRAVRLARAHLALLHRDRAEAGGPESAEAGRARAELDAAYKGLRRAYGITDPDTIRFGLELARMYRSAGDGAVARRLLTIARAGCQAALEPWHPLSSLVRRELAELEPAPAPAPAPALAMAPVLELEPAPAPVQAPLDGPPGRPPVQLWTAAGMPEQPAGARYLPAPVTAEDRRRRAGRRRLVVLLAVALAVIVAAVVTVTVTVAVLTGGRDGGAARRPAARPAPAPPSGHERLRVELRDEGTTLVASWRDPADGPAPVVVAVARDGKEPAVVANLPAGTREYTLTALDPRAEYCVIVGAIYPGEAVAEPTTTCTRRAPGA